MNTSKIIVLGAVVVGLVSSALAGNGAAQLKAQSQPSIVAADSTAVTVAYADAAFTVKSPRGLANQSKTLKGINTDVNPALNCRKNMVASPKAIGACASQFGMPGCPSSVAMK